MNIEEQLAEAVKQRKDAQTSSEFTAARAREQVLRRRLEEFLYTEAKHPRGRGGKWVDVMAKLGGKESRPAHEHPGPFSYPGVPARAGEAGLFPYPGVARRGGEGSPFPYPTPGGAHRIDIQGASFRSKPRTADPRDMAPKGRDGGEEARHYGGMLAQARSEPGATAKHYAGELAAAKKEQGGGIDIQGVSAAERRANPNWREESRGPTPPKPTPEPAPSIPKAPKAPEPPGQPTHVAVKDLSPAIQGMLKSKGYGAKDISVIPTSSVDTYSGGNAGQRGFVNVMNLDTGKHQGLVGSWGGANMFEHSPIDSGQGRIEIPPNGAVLKGSTGYPRTFATLHVHPAAMGRMLPSAEKETPLTTEQQGALYAHGAIKGGQYRRDEMRRLRVPPSAVDSLVASGHLKRNKAGATTITTKGKNAREQYPYAKSGYLRESYEEEVIPPFEDERFTREEIEIMAADLGIDPDTIGEIVVEPLSEGFIQDMHMKKGALHADLGIPPGKKIPVGLIKAAAKKKGTLGRRARLALTLMGISTAHRAKKAAGKAVQESAKTAALSVTHAPIGKGGTNWITKSKPGNTGQIPAYIQNVRNAIMRGGAPQSVATGIAVGRVRDWAEGKGDVHPEVRAAAAAAIAEWDEMRMKSHAKTVAAHASKGSGSSKK